MLLTSNGIRDTDEGIELVGIDGTIVPLGAWDAMKVRAFLMTKEATLLGILQRTSKHIRLEEREHRANASATHHSNPVVDTRPPLPD